MAPFNRRDFLTTAALGMTATLVTTCSRRQSALPHLDFSPQWSGAMTRLALIRDAIALAAQDATLPETLLNALSAPQDVAAMGMLFPSEASAIDFLAAIHHRWFRRSAESDQHRIAIATSYFVHRAAERRIEYSLTASEIATAELDQAKLYQDAEVIRGLMAEPPQTVDQALTLFTALDQRLRIDIHTFIPDETDQRAWVTRLLDWDEAQDVLFRQFAEAVAAPDPGQQARYVDGPNFFNSADPLIAAARSNGAIGAVPIGLGQSSIYAQALADCQQTLSLVGQFIDQSLDAEALTQQLTQPLDSRTG